MGEEGGEVFSRAVPLVLLQRLKLIGPMETEASG
jgi:hypothetical protein